MDRDPTSYGLLTYGWVLLLAAWGGFTNYRARVMSGKVQKFSLAELVGEVSTSAFVGVIAFYLCEAARLDPLWSAAIVGISGHMGGRAIFLFEDVMRSKLGVRWERSHDDNAAQ